MIPAIVTLGTLEIVLRIATYFAVMIFAVKGSQAFNIYINKHK